MLQKNRTKIVDNQSKLAPSAPTVIAPMPRFQPVVSGKYSIRILPGSIHKLDRNSSRGVSFAIQIVEGRFRGRELGINLRLEGNPPFVIERNLNLLADWARIVGAPKAETPVALIADLGRRGQRRPIVLTLERVEVPGGQSWVNPVKVMAG